MSWEETKKRQDEADKAKAAKNAARIRAKERAQERRKGDYDAVRAKYGAMKPDQRRASRDQMRAELDGVKYQHGQEDWNKMQAHKERMYDYHHGKGKARRDMERVNHFARQRAQGLDYMERVQAGEVEYTGNNLEADVKQGKAWEQGNIDAYNDLQANFLNYKKDPTSFNYDSFIGSDYKKPNKENYMGKYNQSYDEWMGR